MELVAAVRERKSIRAFRPDPVKKETIREILEIAGRAPSATNVQPWEFNVITGAVLDEIRRVHLDMLNAGTLPNQDFYFNYWPPGSVYHERQVELARLIFDLMGISREDRVKRAQWLERGFRYFDAPAAIIIAVDRSIPEATQLIDIGAVMQTICLVALNYGLGTCIAYQGVMYPDALRKIAGIPESKRLLVSIAVGYPDWDFPANKLVSSRAPLESITTWIGFESNADALHINNDG